ncbi:AraC family transcriptional regulator [Clostridium guangxiense]|uniref:AraC family transcriptional regulator n=1 Tax=Clostridium guangxiense TaxID=1662055 RepID=UPI001E530FF0|nr:GyrI-like domain-containing protein [Clostridium guangxiense]MCD2346806.1 AraC family transcriptional regulator [Clostridium guangxiense]
MENSQSREEYLHRIHKVQDYIEAHLYDSLSLEELSNIAGFSKFHFHRIFKGIVNEPLSQYVNRLKLEKSTQMLIHRKDMTITDVAYHFGFTDSAVFSRAFKNHYKVSPAYYRNNYSKNCKDPYKISKYNEYVPIIEGKSKSVPVQGDLEILMLSSVYVAYVRYMGSYKSLAVNFSKLLEKLYKYADKQNLIEAGRTKFLAIYHDNPEFTEADKLTTSLCIIIPDNVLVAENSGIGSMIIPSGKYVVGHFNIFENEFSDAWDFMYSEWLTNSGFKPHDSFPFEVYLNDPNTNSEHKILVDIYLPIEPL